MAMIKTASSSHAPRIAVCGIKQKNGAEDLPDTHDHAHEPGHMGAGKIMSGAGHHEQHRLDQNHDAERPLQNGQTDSRFHETLDVPLYCLFSLTLFGRGDFALISVSRWLALESRSRP